MKNGNTKTLIAVIINATLIGILTNIAHPITPTYLSNKGIDTIFFGYFLAAMNLGALLGAPFFGALGDQKGRKYIYLICAIIYGLMQMLFGLLSNPYGIIGIRIIAGITGGTMNASFLSYVARSQKLKENRHQAVSFYIAFLLFGGAIGSALGGLGGYLFPDVAYVFYLQCGLLCFFAIIGMFFLRLDDEEKTHQKSKNPLASFRDLRKLNSWFLTFAFVIFLSSIVFTNVTRYTEKFLTDYGYDTLQIGLFSFGLGLATLGASHFINKPVLRRYKPLLVALSSCFIAGGALAVSYYFVPTGIFTVFFVYIIAKTLFEPASVLVINNNKQVPSGVLMGVRQAILSLGSIVGVLVAGYIYEHESTLLFYICGATMITAGIILVILAIRKEESTLGSQSI